MKSVTHLLDEDMPLPLKSRPSKLVEAQFPDESLQECRVFPSLPTGQNSVA
jgi:hypothetical protein